MMTSELLRESGAGSLTMSLIGCLPDNVQQAIRTFSIRPGSQHITLCFPFMADILQQLNADSAMMTSQKPLMSRCLFFDQSIEVIQGYQSMVTLASREDRGTLPIVMFTLYERGTSEGICRHFESVLKILLSFQSRMGCINLPPMVVDLGASVIEEVIDRCAETLANIHNEVSENIGVTDNQAELIQMCKEKYILPNIVSYSDQLDVHIRETVLSLPHESQQVFLGIVGHIRTMTSSVVDYQKAGTIFKSSTTEPMIRAFWRLWGHDQLAAKVFPMAMSGGRTVLGQLGPFLYPLRPASGMPALDQQQHHLIQVPIKEGLQSIIKCLKAQHTQQVHNSVTSRGHDQRQDGCPCISCYSPLSVSSTRHRHKWHEAQADVIQAHSAFYRPAPVEKGGQPPTNTPYSDALKAAAVLPTRATLTDSPFLTTGENYVNPILGALPTSPLWLRMLSPYSGLYMPSAPTTYPYPGLLPGAENSFNKSFASDESNRFCVTTPTGQIKSETLTPTADFSA